MAVTTTIRLPDDLHEALRRRAFHERRPIADLVRDAVRAMLGAAAGAGAGVVAETADPFERVIGTVGGGAADESAEHDHYLYGSPRRKARRR